MFNKEQIQRAIKEIDDGLASLNGPRQVHIALANDVKLVQAVCMDYFDKGEGVKEDERANIIPINTKPGDKDK